MKRWIVALTCTATVIIAGCSGGETDTEPSDSKEKETEEVSTDTTEDVEQSSPEEETAEEEALAEPPAVDENGVLEDPYDLLALVNKEHHLPSDYEPNDLTVPDVRFPYEEDVPKKQLREPAANALEEMFADAEQEGLYLFAVSGYRSYDRQESIFQANVAQDGEEAANQYSARPGESEHQTGLTMDLSSQSNGFALTTDFGETPEGKWVAENAHNYGFIIRYPEDKTDITNYQYEPWHVRYVGEEPAKEMYENDYTLEEYLGLVEPS